MKKSSTTKSRSSRSSGRAEKRKTGNDINDDEFSGSVKKLKSADTSQTVACNPEMLLIVRKNPRKQKDGDSHMYLSKLDGTELGSFSQNGRPENCVMGRQSKILVIQFHQVHNNNNRFGVFGWNVDDLVAPLYGHHFDHQPSVAMNNTGTLLVLGWGAKPRFCCLTVYDAATGARLYDFPDSQWNIDPFFNFDESLIITTTNKPKTIDIELKLWEIETRSCKSTFKLTDFQYIEKAISHASLPLVAAASTQAVVWDYSGAKFSEVFRKAIKSETPLQDILFVPTLSATSDGRESKMILLCGNYGTEIELWNFETSVCIFAKTAQTHLSPDKVCFDPTCNVIVAACTEWNKGGSIDIAVVWDHLTGVEQNRFVLSDGDILCGLFCAPQTNILM